MGIETLTGSAGSLIMLILKIFAIIAFAAIVFFTSKAITRLIKKKRTFKISAFISNPDGSHMLWKCGKFKDKDGLEKMLFMKKVKMLFGLTTWIMCKGESMPIIDPAHIVMNTVHLFRYGISQYAVIPPTMYRNPNLLSRSGISLINYNMLHWKGLEQRAAISRWAALKDKMSKLTPWIVIGLICLLGGATIFFITKMVLTMYADVTAARIAECSTLIGGGSTPVGV